MGYQEEIERLEPRIARLSGLAQSEGQLEISSSRVDSKIDSLVYPRTDDRAAVAAEMQKNIRELMAASGLRVLYSRMLPAKESEEFDHVQLSLTVSGDMAAFDATLAEIDLYSPLLLVESLDIRPNRASKRANDGAAQSLTVSMQLLSLRAVQ